MIRLPVRASPTGPRETSHRSLWLQEALSVEDAELARRERLHGKERADVCVLGGGYTGLWTALFLKEREPDVDVVIVEADICGGGASGRNGGFALSWWSKLGALVEVCGEEDGLWLAERSEEAVRHIGSFCAEHGIEADFRPAGWLWVATSPAQLGTWEATVEETETRGRAIFERLSGAEAQRRGGSSAYLGGVFDPTAARVHPALLARGMRRVALQRGVRIFEDSAVTAVDGQVPLIVRTRAGTVHAPRVVSALNAWTTGLPPFHGLRRAIVPVVSDIVATAPEPQLLAATGWTGGECVSDSRLLVHYHRTTTDGRIVLGRGGGALGAAGYFGDTFHYDRRRARALAASLRRLYPAFGDVDIAHAWSGPIDRSQTGLPFFGRAAGQENLIYGVGYSGNGVAPSVNGGRILASLALGSSDRFAHNALTRGPARLFPPEPVRYLGGRLVREAVRLKEDLDDQGRTPSATLRYLASLAPAGYFKVGTKKPPADSSSP